MTDTKNTLLQDKEQPAFHDSEFPALGGVLRSANVGIPNGDRPGSLDGSNIYAHIGVHKGLLPSEFNIQSEEFPALPGATGREADGRQSDQQSTNAANQVSLQAVIASSPQKPSFPTLPPFHAPHTLVVPNSIIHKVSSIHNDSLRKSSLCSLQAGGAA